MNPTMLLSLKKKWEEFSVRHPKFVQFLQTVIAQGVGEDCIIDVTVTFPDGKSYQSNMKVTAEDVELIRGLAR
ncbi:MAG: hypothetical protein IKP92_05720 [Lachnospiraceae bacterium]|nr:hypothetical protein [Lachnospiraceae bacterium]